MKISLLFAVIGITASLNTAFAQDHGHLNVGATGVNQNDPLIFDNGPDFATTTDYVKTLTFATNGVYAGYYQGNITFTALAATLPFGGPADNHPAPGSRIFAQLVSVEGPDGGAFSFWDSGATSPTFTLLSGTTGTNLWRLSENDGSPDTDPYGHIHGRRFTATKPGIYAVGFRAFDLSTNGVGGGSIHMPSAVLKMYFQAGVNLKGIKVENGFARVQFSAPLGNTWTLESSDTFDPNNSWNNVGDPIEGDDHFHELMDNSGTVEKRFYRLRAITP